MENTTLRPQKRDGTVLEVSKLADAAKAAGVSVTEWQTCVDKKETNDRFASETSEAQKYGLGGTPGTLIVNMKTGKYATVE
jgi:predicted DsbA family dithiol-disulfide isomerase